MANSLALKIVRWYAERKQELDPDSTPIPESVWRPRLRRSLTRQIQLARRPDAPTGTPRADAGDHAEEGREQPTPRGVHALADHRRPHPELLEVLREPLNRELRRVLTPGQLDILTRLHCDGLTPTREDAIRKTVKATGLTREEVLQAEGEALRAAENGLSVRVVERFWAGADTDWGRDDTADEGTIGRV